MSARLIQGKPVADEVRSALTTRIARLKARGVVPGLAVVLVGDDPASVSYVRGKERACAELGIRSQEHRIASTTTELELIELLHALNADNDIHGILVQLPLPDGIDADRIISTILPAKDVDGFHPVNLGRIMIGKPIFLPCTPRGILSLLSASGTQLSGAHVVIVGRSRVVGLPLANMLLQRNPEANATVTVCHRATPDLGTHTRAAEVLIVAAGQPEIIRGTMVKKGAVVIDVGVNRISAPERSKGYRLVGDVAFDEVKEVAGAITPVPGGVGPMTIAMLMQNSVEAAERASEARGGAA